jgi:hypothetical protein
MREVLSVTVALTHSVVPGTQYLPRAAHHALLSRPGPNAAAIWGRMSSVSPFHVAVTISREERSPGRPAVPLGGPYTNCGSPASPASATGVVNLLEDDPPHPTDTIPTRMDPHRRAKTRMRPVQ